MVNGCFLLDYFPKHLALSLERRYNRGTQEPYISQEEAAMIFDTLDHIDTYKNIHPGLYKALTILRDTDFDALTADRVEVDGKNLFFFVQNYETKVSNDTPEAHRAYADIQVVLEGREKMGVAPLKDMTQEVEARPEGDIWFYRGPVDCVTLTPGKFAVLFPQDAHAPCIAVEAPEKVRKCVFKVKL